MYVNSMDVIADIINRTCKFLEDICNDTECKIDSGCCQTHKHAHLKDPTEILTSQDEILNNSLNQNDLKRILCEAIKSENSIYKGLINAETLAVIKSECEKNN